MKKNLLIIVMIAVIIVILTGIIVFATQNKEEKSLTTKSEQQIAYLEEKVITMMNYLNHIRFSNSIVVEQNIDNNSENSQQNKQSSEGSSSGSSQQNGEGSNQSQGSSQESSGSENRQEESSSEDNVQYNVKSNSILTNQNQEIDWDYVKNNIEMIYSTWPSMVVDLHELNVKNEDILTFSSTLDQVTLSAKQEDKTVTLNNLASLYALLPNYRNQISKDTQEINLDYTKGCLINSYALLEQDKWEEVGIQIQQAISYFSNIMNNIEGNGQKQSHISKIYVSLNELNNTVENRDKDLFYIKYRNTMEELVEF